MKKFLAIFMVVAVVMGMAFIVMSSADEADFTYTVNVSEVVDGKVKVSIDVDTIKPLSAISMTVKVTDNATIVKKLLSKLYYSGVDTTYEGTSICAFDNMEGVIHGNEITFTTASLLDAELCIGGSAGLFPASIKGLINFDINYDGPIDENTVVVSYVKCTTGRDEASSAVKYNLPAAPITTTEEPAPITTTEEPAPTTTAKDPGTSDGSSIGMFAFIALAAASLACAVVVIIRRKRA